MKCFGTWTRSERRRREPPTNITVNQPPNPSKQSHEPIHFPEHCPEVGQRRAVRKRREAGGAQDGVELSLGRALDSRVDRHEEDERAEGR